MTLSETIEAFKKLPTRKQAQLVHALLQAGDFSQSNSFYDVEIAFDCVAGDLAEDEGFEGFERSQSYVTGFSFTQEGEHDFWPIDAMDLVERFEPITIDGTKGVML